jgi:hypothetical protein
MIHCRGTLIRACRFPGVSMRSKGSIVAALLTVALLGACADDASDEEEDREPEVSEAAEDPSVSGDDGLAEDPDGEADEPGQTDDPSDEADEGASGTDVEPAADDGTDDEADAGDADVAPADEAALDEDPFAVPDEVNADYVDLVVNELFAIQEGLLIAILSRPPGERIPASESARLETVFTGPWYRAVRSEHSGYAQWQESREGLLDEEEPGRTRWRTEMVLHVEEERCMVVIGEYDNTEVYVEPWDSDIRRVISLRRDGSLRPNPTGWTLHQSAAMIDEDEELIDREHWRSVDYSPLETSCEREPTG